jgi:hypothetical protein
MVPHREITCPGRPNLIELTDHAEGLAEWLGFTRECSIQTEQTDAESWPSVAYWISLAAGLREVHIEFYTRSSWFCSGAREYEAAQGETASSYHAELTRMLYVYNGVDVMSRILTPDLPRNSDATYRVRRILGSSARTRLRHNQCVLLHIAHHVESHEALRRSVRLQNIISSIYRDPVTATADIGFQFRHLFVHGGMTHPGPAYEDGRWGEGAQADRCIVQHATACLLFTLQRIAIFAVNADRLIYAAGDVIEIDDGIWDEQRTLTLINLVRTSLTT